MSFLKLLNDSIVTTARNKGITIEGKSWVELGTILKEYTPKNPRDLAIVAIKSCILARTNSLMKQIQHKIESENKSIEEKIESIISEMNNGGTITDLDSLKQKLDNIRIPTDLVTQEMIMALIEQIGKKLETYGPFTEHIIPYSSEDIPT